MRLVPDVDGSVTSRGATIGFKYGCAVHVAVFIGQIPGYGLRSGEHNGQPEFL